MGPCSLANTGRSLQLAVTFLVTPSLALPNPPSTQKIIVNQKALNLHEQALREFVFEHAGHVCRTNNEAAVVCHERFLIIERSNPRLRLILQRGSCYRSALSVDCLNQVQIVLLVPFATNTTITHAVLRAGLHLVGEVRRCVLGISLNPALFTVQNDPQIAIVS